MTDDTKIELAREAYLRAIADAWRDYEEAVKKAEEDAEGIALEVYQEGVEVARKKQIEAFLAAHKAFEKAVKGE